MEDPGRERPSCARTPARMRRMNVESSRPHPLYAASKPSTFRDHAARTPLCAARAAPAPRREIAERAERQREQRREPIDPAPGAVTRQLREAPQFRLEAVTQHAGRSVHGAGSRARWARSQSLVASLARRARQQQHGVLATRSRKGRRLRCRLQQLGAARTPTSYPSHPGGRPRARTEDASRPGVFHLWHAEADRCGLAANERQLDDGGIARITARHGLSALRDEAQAAATGAKIKTAMGGGAGGSR